jgi:zinc transporter ZupT
MEQIFWLPLMPSLLAAAVTAAGISVIRLYEAWALANTPYFACFAAGVLVSASFLHIILSNPS